MKKLMLFLILGIFLTSFVAATEFDNVAWYSKNDMKVEIRNWLGLTSLGFAELKSHNSVSEIKYVSPGEDKLVMYYEFTGWDLYEQGLTNVEFIDVKSGNKVDKEYYFAKAIYETVEVNDYVRECNLVKSINGSNDYTVCGQVIGGTHNEEHIIGWERLETRDIPNEDITIGLFTEVHKGDYIDGVWEIAGQKVSKHAEWTTNLNIGLVSYWTLNDTLVDSLGVTDLTSYPASIEFGPNIIGEGAKADGTNKLNASYLLADKEAFTLSFWLNGSASACPTCGGYF